MKDINISKIDLIIIFLVAMLFYLWIKIIWIALTIFIILDSIKTRILSKLLMRFFPNRFFTLLKYIYIMILPLVVLLFIRTFFFDIYYVPSSSMENAVFQNDYVIINKFLYGVKIPENFQDIPGIGFFFKTKINRKQGLEFNSIYSFMDYKKEDIVVFKSVENDKFLIKRIIGMPGDTLIIKNAETLINSKRLQERPTYRYNYSVISGVGKTRTKNYANKELDTVDINNSKIVKIIDPALFSINSVIFPFEKQEDWTIDNYGPIVIPKKGMTIILNNENLSFYREVILNFEKKKFSFEDSFIPYSYTFKNDYFFVLGDNRHLSIDSRNFGFIPELNIMGRMSFSF